MKWASKDQVKFKNSIAQDAFKQRRALIINDVDTYRKHQGTKLLKAHKLKGLIAIPLFIEDRFLGSLSLYASEPSKFRLIETDFLEKMGKQCSLAILQNKYWISISPPFTFRRFFSRMAGWFLC
jgi:transcriptional regulator with GAF, ATPase, and Fis domain